MAKIGIGLPTYNRSAQLRTALECLKAQVDADFTVMVTDNASPDDTAHVFDEVVGDDPRFVYFRHEPGVPVTENFLHSLYALNTEYFAWRADDDVSSDDFLVRLSDALDRHPWADIAVSSVTRLRGDEVLPIPLPQIPEADPVARAMLLLRNCRPTWFYGIWRRDVLIESFKRGQAHYPYSWAGDHAILLPSVMAGRVTGDGEAMFYQRLQEGTASYELGPLEQLKARQIYADLAAEIFEELPIEADAHSEYRKALEFHIDERVGRRRKLRRAVFKQKFANLLQWTPNAAP